MSAYLKLSNPKTSSCDYKVKLSNKFNTTYYKKLRITGTNYGSSTSSVTNYVESVTAKNSSSVYIKGTIDDGMSAGKTYKLYAYAQAQNGTWYKAGYDSITMKDDKVSWYIKVSLPTNRANCGTLKFYADKKLIHTCDCRGQGNYTVKPASIPWNQSNGDTPTGKVNGHTIAPNKKSDSNGYVYGTNRRIALDDPISGNFKEAYSTYGRSGIQIHGGRNQSKLWNTSGCIRVFDKDIKKITEYIDDNCEKYGLVTITEN